MAEEKFDAGPPKLHENLEAARQGEFRPYNPAAYEKLFSPDATQG